MTISIFVTYVYYKEFDNAKDTEIKSFLIVIRVYYKQKHLLYFILLIRFQKQRRRRRFKQEKRKNSPAVTFLKTKV